MGVVPKKTSPLTKFVRTGEGVLVFAFNLTMLIVPIVSSALTPEEAVKWAGIVNGIAVISRTGLKIVAEVSKATGIEPQPIGNVTSQVVTADPASAVSNGGAPEVVAEPTDLMVTDEDAVEVPQASAITPVSAAPSTAAVATDPQVSDQEEFSSVPSPDEGDDEDGIDISAMNGAGTVTEGLEPVIVGVPTDPVVTDGGGGHVS